MGLVRSVVFMLISSRSRVGFARLGSPNGRTSFLARTSEVLASGALSSGLAGSELRTESEEACSRDLQPHSPCNHLTLQT